MLPNRLMAFWSGTYMSWLRYMTLYTARKHNPDAEIILYNSPEPTNRRKKWDSHNIQDSHYYEGPNYFDDLRDLKIRIVHWKPPVACEPAQQCDLIQWYSMYNQGGIFIDMDIIFTDSLDSLFNRTENILLCYHGFFSIGITGGQKGAAFHKTVYDKAVKTFTADNYSSCGTATLYQVLGSPDRVTNPLAGIQDTYYNIPMDAFYKYDWQHLDKLYLEDSPMDGILGLHWYGGAPISKEWNNKLYPSTISKYDNTIARVLREQWHG